MAAACRHKNFAVQILQIHNAETFSGIIIIMIIMIIIIVIIIIASGHLKTKFWLFLGLTC